MAPPSKPYQLMEISIMSAQDLHPVIRKMKTYAVAWTNSKRKLSTRIDTKGNKNPTWNDKFVFRVDEEFLRCETSGITIEIYTTHWFRDVVVGTVYVLVGNLVPPPRPFHNTYNGGMRCVALQVRRPSGRTQGILNIGVAVIDSTMRSMPLYKQMNGSAVGFRDLMGMEDDESQLDPGYHYQTDSTIEPPFVRPLLFRSRSENSSMFDGGSMANSSMVAVPIRKGKPAGSILSGLELGGSLVMNSGKKGKARSIVSGAELHDRSKSMGKKNKANSVIGSSVLSKDSRKDENNSSVPGGFSKTGAYDTGKYVFRPPPKPYSMLSGSEIGPSASEVAAMMLRRYPLEDDKSSSILDEWNYDETDEGLRSKLERWKSELPPVYNAGLSSSNSFGTYNQHKKEHENGDDNGLFSVFGNLCGYEFQCVCGTPPSAKSTKTKSRSRRLRSSASIGSSSSLSF